MASSEGEGKVVVITGASAGIGAALAHRLASEGHRLVLGARRAAQLRRVANEAESRGAAAAHPVETDVTRRADVERLRDEAIAAFGGFDVWVNNAGRGITRSVLDLSDEDVDEMIAVNLKSALYGMQAAVPHFIERGRGHLINVSSFLGRVPLATFRSAYSASKAALNSLTANLRMDLRQRAPGVVVSLVMPGVVTTEFARNVRGEPLPPVTGRAGNTQTAEEVAEVIAALIREPRAEVYTNPASADLARSYLADVQGFEARLTSGPTA